MDFRAVEKKKKSKEITENKKTILNKLSASLILMGRNKRSVIVHKIKE